MCNASWKNPTLWAVGSSQSYMTTSISTPSAQSINNAHISVDFKVCTFPFSIFPRWQYKYLRKSFSHQLSHDSSRVNKGSTYRWYEIKFSVGWIFMCIFYTICSTKNSMHKHTCMCGRRPIAIICFDMTSNFHHSYSQSTPKYRIVLHQQIKKRLK
jgi:hypothetical protein